MIPRHIHQIWMGTPIPERVIVLCRDMQERHPSWKYTLWRDQDIDAIKQQMSAESLHWFNHFASQGIWALATDLIRYHIIKSYGGIYLDCDFKIKSTLDNLPIDTKTLILANMRFPAPKWPDKCRIQSCVFAATKDHPFITHICNTIGKEDYILTRCRRPEPFVQYNCQFLTTEYHRYITPGYRGKLPINATMRARKLPDDHYIAPAEIFFGRRAKVAKHLYFLTHRNK